MQTSFSQPSLPYSSYLELPLRPRRRLVFARTFPVASDNFYSVTSSHLLLCSRGFSFCERFSGIKLWILDHLSLRQHGKHLGSTNEFKNTKIRDKHNLENTELNEESATYLLKGSIQETTRTISQHKGSSLAKTQSKIPTKTALSAAAHSSSSFQTHPPNFGGENDTGPSLCIAVIGATGELAKSKIFPALFALYYSGFLPENVGIFGYSRKNLTDEDLRSIIASTLTCRIDHQQNCGDKMDAFLSQTYYIDGGYDNNQGMSKLNARMEQVERGSKANRIFYLSVPQEALLDVASCLADKAQTCNGWNRIIIEKPFGFDPLSSSRLTKSLLSKFEENQIYRIDHLLGRNIIENLTVLRFSNLVFEPLWSRKYIRSVQVTLSEDAVVQAGRYFDGYGIIRDIVQSHILQTIALLAMEPPISLDDEDIRNEKVKVLRSIRELNPRDVILGQYKDTSGDKVDLDINNVTATYFAAALYIDNARWDGVPFLITTGMGLIKHRVEIRIQFHHVPGNLYRERLGHNIDLTTNELILRDVPDEAILVRINNKIPGLALQLDASELNLLYKDRYNMEVPDSYEHLLHDVVDGDNHLFMRSDELAAAWNILSPVLQEIDKKHISPELYELGGRGPIGTFYLWAKHGVRWLDD